METGKYADLSTGQLLNRKKYAFILTVVLAAAIVLDLAALIYNLATGKGFNNVLFAAAATCIVVLIPIYLGRKKIEEEIRNREKT